MRSRFERFPSCAPDPVVAERADVSWTTITRGELDTEAADADAGCSRPGLLVYTLGMNTRSLTLDGIPITVLEGGSAESASRGALLCYHGFTSSTEVWLHDLERFARDGFTVVGVDCVGHGRRRRPDFDRRFADPSAKEEALIDVVRATSAEIQVLIDALAREGIAREESVGAFGVSMGGFIVYAAVVREPRIRAAVSLLGSPDWWMHPAPDSPHRHIDAFDRIRLLSLTAGRDEAVPPAHAATFHARLARRFDDHATRLRHVDYPASGHFMEPDDWEEAIGESLGWFERHL